MTRLLSLLRRALVKSGPAVPGDGLGGERQGQLIAHLRPLVIVDPFGLELELPANPCWKLDDVLACVAQIEAL